MDALWLVLSIPSALNSLLTGLTDERTQPLAQGLSRSGTVARPKYRVVGIPNYFPGELEDSIDLQVKSLLYNYRRSKINALGPFLRSTRAQNDPNGGGNGSNGSNEAVAPAPSLGVEFDYISSPYTVEGGDQDASRFVHNARLDQIYAVDRFKEELLNDPYRVLIDYPKNKFRSMLILSDDPVETQTLPEVNTAQKFRFLVLRPGDDDEQYFDVLVNRSGIFAEHRLSSELRMRVLARVLARQRNASGGLFDKDDRARVIQSYVQKLALHVQVERIYRATLKSKEREAKEAMLKFSKAQSIQSYKSLKRQRSSRKVLGSNSNTANVMPQIMDESSPKRQSQSPNTHNNNNTLVTDDNDMENENEQAEVRASDSESQASSSSSSSFTKMFSPEEKALFYEQSKMAVRIRIERERLYLV